MRGRDVADACERPWPWRGALLLLALLVVFLDRAAVSGDWYRSGNDMQSILPALKAAGPEQARGWWSGPWVGAELFRYYRPVTSVLWLVQFQRFGEDVARWQMVSVGLHAATVVFLAALCRRCLGAALPAWLAALLWATRERTIWGIEWTPAQTDHLAGFFGVGALLAWASGAERAGALRALWMGAALLLAALAMGAKEIALTVPLLMAWWALWAPALSRRAKLGAAAGALALLVAFFLWRTHALGGIGFIPGQAATPGRLAAPAPTPLGWLRTMAGYLLPGPLGPLTPMAAGVPWSIGALALAWQRLPGRAWRVGLALLVFALATWWIEDPFFWLLPETAKALAIGLAAFGLTSLLIRRTPRELSMVVGWGTIAFLPLYHVVYNRAGNVTYLPETYWALAWTLLLRVAIRGR